MIRNLPVFLLSFLPCHGAGFADGVKIGEVTKSSAILWARLTAGSEAGNWKRDAPNWTVPGEEGKLRFNFFRKGDRESMTCTPWWPVDSSTDFCHSFKIEWLEPDTRYVFEA